MYHGDIRLGDTIDIKFTTTDTTGLPTTLAGTPVISAYPGNSLTEVTAGITLTVDFDARTGMHNIQVAATSGNGYATATNYALAITAGTVGGTSVVGYVVGTFSIENRSAVMPTTVARTLDVSATGEAGLDWANIGSPTTAVSLSGTTVATATNLTTNNDKTGYALTAGERNSIADAHYTRQMTEGYNADGTAPTMEQAFSLILQLLSEFAISGTTLTVKKLDGSTTAATFTLDSASAPTSITRAT